jgi:hypothetical protein
MKREEFKTQADALWNRIVLPQSFSSPIHGSVIGPDYIRIHYVLCHVHGVRVQERTIKFEMRKRRLLLGHRDGEIQTALPNMEAIGTEMQKFVDAFVADCQKKAP